MLKEQPDAIVFEPVKGRVMEKYVVVLPSIMDDEDEFGEWLALSVKYVSSLPLKKGGNR
jgi:hypothetical protein